MILNLFNSTLWSRRLDQDRMHVSRDLQRANSPLPLSNNEG